MIPTGIPRLQAVGGSKRCTYLREWEEDYLQTSFWDMNPSSPSNGTPTAAECSESEPQRDGSPTCGCMKEMSGCSIHPNTRDEWVASMQASLVLILAALGIEPDSAKAQEAAFIEKCSGLLASYDHATCSWKTSAQSFLPGLDEYSETWPRSGMTVGGHAYRHRQPVPRTTVIGGGALRNVPTPTVNGNYNRKGASQNSGDGLATYVKMWPTPTATLADHGGRITPSKARHGGTLIEHISHLMWPTPTASNFECKDLEKLEARRQRMKLKHGNGNGFGMTLGNAVKMWPTLSATDYKGSVTQSLVMERLEHPRGVRLPEELVRRGETGGQLNPDWTEWLMGFPIGHTALKPSATPKSRCKPRSRGNS